MNHYQTLGISPDANQAEISRAYRQLAAKMHPDAGGDPEAFKRVVAAYEVLSDPDKRSRYDNGEDPDDRGDFIIVFELMNEFAFHDGGDMFEQIRKRINSRKKKSEAKVEKVQRMVAKLKKRFEKAKRENAGTKNQSGFKLVTSVFETQIEYAEHQLSELKTDVSDLDSALGIIEDLKCSGDLPPFARYAQDWTGSMPFRFDQASGESWPFPGKQ